MQRQITPEFETSSKPWFGPRSRAKKFLAARNIVDSPSVAARKLSEMFPDHASLIQRIRFVDFRHKDEHDFHYTIAVIWMDSNPVFRQKIYEDAERVVTRTGWYPLPQGERIGSRLAFADLRSSWEETPHELPFKATRICGFESAAKEGGGTAIRVLTDGDSILLDCALPGNLRLCPSDRVLLLSHSHRDHSGNLPQVISTGATVLLSSGTLGVLRAIGMAPEALEYRQLLRIYGGRQTKLGALIVTPFTVPHSPGSVGYRIEDCSHVLIFPGDVSLRTARHDFLPCLEKQMPTGKKNVLFLDATMAGRTHGAGFLNPADGVIEALRTEKNVFIMSGDAEQLLYAYVDLFSKIKGSPEFRDTVSFVCPEKLRRIFELVHSDFIKRNGENLDQFILQQYRRTFSAWAESRWLFWLEGMPSLSTGTPKTLWFVTPERCKQLSSLSGSCFLVGRFAGAQNREDNVGTVKHLDTSAWTLHSNEAELLNARRLASKAKLVLFHNFTSRLKKFIKLHNFPGNPLERTIFS
jgi:glyoxylase-like metal-dependent hydrolase (beta-lactamase superfamily II)